MMIAPEDATIPITGNEVYVDQSTLDVLKDLFINRSDTYAVQKEDGQYIRINEPLTKTTLRKHLTGEITIGGYQIDPSTNTVRWLCFDIDPEHIEEPQQAASKLYNECMSRFHKQAVLLEASRYPDPSFHIWVFFAPPIHAKAARWLGRKILEHSGIIVELFPKQDTVKPSDFGNLVKLPLGLHRKAKKWSCFLNWETWQPLPITYLNDVWGCSFPEKDIQRILELSERQRDVQLKFLTTTQTYGRKGKIRPCFSEALKNLELPHQMRLAVAIEYLNSDFDVTQIVNLFRNQEDFDEKKTLYQVSHVKEKGYTSFKCSTIRNIGYCIGDACPIFRKRKQRFETMVIKL